MAKCPPAKHPSARQNSREMANALQTTLYRQLMKVGRTLDRAPRSKALLLNQPSAFFDRRRGACRDLPALDGTAAQLAALLRACMGGDEYYIPQRSVVDAVRSARSQPVNPDVDQIDVGMRVLRHLAQAASAGEALEPHANAAAAAAGSKLVSSLAPLRRCTTPEVGTLLLTHPVACLKQPSLHRSVILIVESLDEHVQGVILNKPLVPRVKLGGAVPEPLKESIASLLDAPLYFGGDVGGQHLLVLHEVTRYSPRYSRTHLALAFTLPRRDLDVTSQLDGLSDSVRVADGLHVTSHHAQLSEALSTAPEGQRRTRCVAGHAGWAPEQLANELRRGVWFVAAPDSPSAIAELALLDPSVIDRRLSPPNSPKNSPALELGVRAAEPEDTEVVRDTLWSGCISALGGEFAEIAEIASDGALIWRHVEGAWEGQLDELERRIMALDGLKMDDAPGGDDSA